MVSEGSAVRDRSTGVLQLKPAMNRNRSSVSPDKQDRSLCWSMAIDSTFSEGGSVLTPRRSVLSSLRTVSAENGTPASVRESHP